MVGDRADRADRERVVTAEHDGDPAVGERVPRRVAHRAHPGRDLGEVAVPRLRPALRIGGSADIAAVLDIHALGAQRVGEARHAQRLRSHRGAALAAADIGRHTDERRGRAACRRGHAALSRAAGARSSEYRSFGSRSEGTRSTPRPSAFR